MSEKKFIKEIFSEISEGLLGGSFGEKTTIALTLHGSELGIDNLLKGAHQFANENKDTNLVLIGPEVNSPLKQYHVKDENEQAKKMEELLDSGEIDGCVTRHYSFPIGVSTVGKVETPALGEEVYIATTTGTSSTNRVQSMVMNAVAGIICAKACGIEKPTVGILNIDGARQVERALLDIKEAGYDIEFSTSNRADGGTVMRGNDLLQGTPDIMVCDSLTGNIIQKTFSSYTTGGNFESVGSGYGPGVGEDYSRLVLILSRVSGAPVVKNAIRYAADLASGKVIDIAKEEYKKLKKIGYDAILEKLVKTKVEAKEEEIVAPPEEITTETIEGIDILELEDAVKVLWKENIYAMSGMGCTGPIIMVSDKNKKKAGELLVQAGYITKANEETHC